MNQTKVKAYGTESAEAPLNQLSISRRAATPHDVEIEIAYAEYVTRICIRRGMSGMERFILVYPDMRSSVRLSVWAIMLASSSWVTWLE